MCVRGGGGVAGLHSWDAWCAHWSHIHAATLRACAPWIAKCDILAEM